MKKVLTIFLSLALALSIAACGGKASLESPAPAESSKIPSSETGAVESGWLIFQIKPDEKELTMKYDQLFDTVFSDSRLSRFGGFI